MLAHRRRRLFLVVVSHEADSVAYSEDARATKRVRTVAQSRVCEPLHQGRDLEGGGAGSRYAIFSALTLRMISPMSEERGGHGTQDCWIFISVYNAMSIMKNTAFNNPEPKASQLPTAGSPLIINE